MNRKDKKILIAYYSRKGENYLNGSIVNLPMGNTEVVAQVIQKITGGDLFEIRTVNDYPHDYNETTRVAMSEKKSNARPELASHVINMDQYDTIILGYPNWWGTFPMAVFTFLEEYNFTEKTIRPFGTHEGSGLGTSEGDIKRLCPTANVENGLAIRGSSVHGSENALRRWLG